MNGELPLSTWPYVILLSELFLSYSDHCLPEIIDCPLVVQGWSSTTTLTGLPPNRPTCSSGYKGVPIDKPMVPSISVMPNDCILPAKISEGKNQDKSIPVIQLDVSRSANCVDEELEVPMGTDDCSPLHKTVVNSPPRICVSRCSTQRSKAATAARGNISHHSQQLPKMEISMDIESDNNTSSITSLGTQTRKLHRERKSRKDTCPDLRPKLAQSTSNRLKVARARMGIVELSEENGTANHHKSHYITTSHTSPHRVLRKRKASNGLGSIGPSPRRQPMQPTTKPRQSLTRRELIPHKGQPTHGARHAVIT